VAPEAQRGRLEMMRGGGLEHILADGEARTVKQAESLRQRAKSIGR
jgi:hypothetical protein